MKENNIKIKQLSEYTDNIELIHQCGVLDMTVEDISILLSQRADRETINNLFHNPESEEYQAWRHGRAEGKFNAMNILSEVAKLGYDGSWHALSEAQKSNRISQKIKENFGLE